MGEINLAGGCHLRLGCEAEVSWALTIHSLELGVSDVRAERLFNPSPQNLHALPSVPKAPNARPARPDRELSLNFRELLILGLLYSGAFFALGLTTGFNLV